MDNCAHCHWGLTTLPGEVNVRFIVFFSLFDRTQGRVRGEKTDRESWNISSIRRAWVLPGKINAMENCAHFYQGLTTVSGEVNVRFFVLLSLFDRAQGRVRGGKAGRLTWNITSIRRHGCFQARKTQNSQYWAFWTRVEIQFILETRKPLTLYNDIPKDASCDGTNLYITQFRPEK